MKKEKAYRYGVNEGVRLLREGDVKARVDIAERFPLFATATVEEIVAEVTSEYMTVRQVNIRMKKRLFKDQPVDDEKEDNDNEDLPDPEENEDTPEDDILEDTADEISEIEKELTDDIPDPEPVEEVKAEVVKKPKEDITEDDLDDLFSDDEDIPDPKE